MTDLVFKDSGAIREALDHATYIEKLKSALDSAHNVEENNFINVNKSRNVCMIFDFSTISTVHLLL